jgi:hypothetical protein
VDNLEVGPELLRNYWLQGSGDPGRGGVENKHSTDVESTIYFFSARLGVTNTSTRPTLHLLHLLRTSV